MNDKMTLDQIEALLDDQPDVNQVGLCLMMIGRIAGRTRTDADRGKMLMAVRMFLDSVIELMEGEMLQKH